MSSTNAVLETHHLTKHFGYTSALVDVDVEIYPGQIVGLIGANGAGKSTLLRHAVGLYLPTSGHSRTLGHDSTKLPQEALEKIGYVHQEGELIGWMTPRKIIRYIRPYYPRWNEQLERELIERFELPLDGKIKTFSPGHRQRLAILLQVCFDPQLLILDEPAAALDPIARARFLDVLVDVIQEESRAIVISSHILSDLEKVIDHVIIMDHGRIIVSKGYDELRESYSRVTVTALNGELPSDIEIASAKQMDRDSTQATFICASQDAREFEVRTREQNLSTKTTLLTLDEIYSYLLS